MDSSTAKDLNPRDAEENVDASSNAETSVGDELTDVTSGIDNLEFLDAEEPVSTNMTTCTGATRDTDNHSHFHTEGSQEAETEDSAFKYVNCADELDTNMPFSSITNNEIRCDTDVPGDNDSNCRSDISKGDNSPGADTHKPEGTSDDEEEYLSAEEGDDDIAVDEENLKEIEETLTEEDKKMRREQAQEYKEEGNKLFKDSQYSKARKAYGKALQLCPLAFPKDRSIMYSNRAACHMRSEEFEKAIEDSTKALELNPNYVKALQRRAELYEKSEKLDEALTDYTKLYEKDPSNHAARDACMRLPDQIKERNEKMKEEMLGKLKELGNLVLKPFGLSTNNFQLQQDPNSGGYSVKFNNNGS